MKTIRSFFHLLPLLLLWLMLSIFLWAWIFTFLTDAPAEKKIMVFADCEHVESKALAILLEEKTGESISLVQVRPFSYAMMNDSEISNADLYIARASDFEDYKSWFAPLPERMKDCGEIYAEDGQPWGVMVYDAETGNGAAKQYFSYEPKDYYLFFGAESMHLLENQDAVDDEAVTAAFAILNIK